MRGVRIVFCLLIVGLFCSSGLWAQIDNLSNMSTDWIRMSNRNAATDSADIVIYNPAGLVKLKDGFHLSFSNQTLIRKPKHSFDLGMGFGVESYEQDSSDPIVPCLYMAYKKNNWSVYGGIYIPGGGAVADYPLGSINSRLISVMVLPIFGGAYNTVSSHSLEASSLYLTTTAGVAYAINDVFSVSAGVRYIMAKNKLKAHATFGDMTGFLPDLTMRVDGEDTANGAGAVFGLNISPGKGFNIGIHYETKVKLDFETKINKDDFMGAVMVDGQMNRRDFPGMLGIGVSYDINPSLRAEVDFSYYFQEQADWGGILTLQGAKNFADFAGNGYSIGGCLVYQASSKLELSMGTVYTKFEFPDMDSYYMVPGAFEVLYSDDWHVGAGFSYEFAPQVKLTAGFSRTFWKSETIKALLAFPLDVDVETSNATYTIAVGINASF